jgi:hypothetical protein
MAVEVATIVERMQTAGRSWEAALDAHALAPPDRNFPVRLRQLADAAAEEAAAFELAARGGLGWRSRAIEGEFVLAPELAPGMNRPGPEELWERFDQAVAALGQALSGSSPAALAAAFSELSEVAGVLAVEVGQLYRTGRVGRAGR